jgi:hypothetical protein
MGSFKVQVFVLIRWPWVNKNSEGTHLLNIADVIKSAADNPRTENACYESMELPLSYNPPGLNKRGDKPMDGGLKRVYTAS